MAINPLCCYGLQRNATDLKPQASQTTRAPQGEKKTEMEAKSKKKNGKKNAVLHSGRECLI